MTTTDDPFGPTRWELPRRGWAVVLDVFAVVVPLVIARYAAVGHGPDDSRSQDVAVSFFVVVALLLAVRAALAPRRVVVRAGGIVVGRRRVPWSDVTHVAAVDGTTTLDVRRGGPIRLDVVDFPRAPWLATVAAQELRARAEAPR